MLLGMQQIKDLRANPNNPRIISDEKLKLLKKALEEFGDLGGFVFNRKSKLLVGGHQRAKVFSKDTKVFIEKKYVKPTRTGTIAEGYVIYKGERFKYREVIWDELKEKAANIAANKGAGEWDLPKLTEWLKDLNTVGFDLDLTMFDEKERKSMLKVTEKIEFDASTISDSEFLIVIECESEKKQQNKLFEEFSTKGLTCKIM